MSELLTKILYFVWVLNSLKCQREIPTSACIRPKPFKTRFDTCANFSEICVKTDDIDCKNLLSACQDCPTSKINILILQDLLKSNDQLNSELTCLKKINIGLLVFVILVLFLFVLEVRFKVFTKCCEKLTRRDTEKSIIKFQVENHPAIQMKVPDHERIINTKRTLCSQSEDLNPHDYKIMKLKYDGVILNDDQYLMSFIHPDNKIVQCIFDRSIDHKNFIVLNFFGNFSVPEFVQIETNKTINDLKKIIRPSTNITNICLYYKRIDLIKLQDEKRISEFDLKDDDKIEAIEEEEGELCIDSIYEDAQEKVKYSNHDLVSVLTNTMAKQLKKKPENIALFCNKRYLEKEKFIFEFYKKESKMNFCLLEMWQKDIKQEFIAKGDFSTVLYVREKDKELVVKQYSLHQNNNLMEHKAFLNELIILHKTKEERRFVKLHEACRHEELFYIKIEKMENGSISEYLEHKNIKDINENTIAKWSKEILEGLQYLHQLTIIHCDLKPSNILLDGNLEIRISSFGLSMTFNDPEEKNLIKDIVSKKFVKRFLAPEILNNQSFNVSVDIWSFGATLIKIATGQNPLCSLNENDAAKYILENKKIEFKLSENRPNELKQFIEACLKGDPERRLSIKALNDHQYLKRYL